MYFIFVSLNSLIFSMFKIEKWATYAIGLEEEFSPSIHIQSMLCEPEPILQGI